MINIIGVRGLNDATGQATIAGTCTTCHDSPNVGDHSVKAPLDIGVTDDPAMPRTADMPLFTLQCTQGPLTGRTFMTTDPGRALITGKCADIAKVKGPILRGLSGRAPYFQAGEAATLEEAVDFYERRFGVGFTAQERTDLVNFLKTL